MADVRQRSSNSSNHIGPNDLETANIHNNGNGSFDKSPGDRHTSSRFPTRISKAGQSYRSGIHPWKFLKVCFKSSSLISKFVNILWPFVPAAITVHCVRPDLYRVSFALNYIAMIPTANLIGFSGQQLARKLPKVFGVILETFLGSIVEIILLLVLLRLQVKNSIRVIRDAILGSILANLLLCLGTCFLVGGLREESQQFDAVISEVGSGLLLTAGFALAIPCAFSFALRDGVCTNTVAIDFDRETPILGISRATSVILLFTFVVYVWFQMHTHHGLYDSILEKDEEKDKDREKDEAKERLTLTECAIALAVALALVSMHAVFLVKGIEPLVAQDNVSELFMGLILVPLVEKLAEHLTAVDEAWDNQMNFALAHVLGSTLQTALLNSSLVVIVGWGMKQEMDLNFSPFEVILLLLAIIVVGNFIRDRESNYLEGVLCVAIYLIIAVATYYYPNESLQEEEVTGENPAAAGAEVVHRLLMGHS